MARKTFIRDLEQAKANPPAHITDVARYDGDGVSFVYWYTRGGFRRKVCLKLITTNADDYPDDNQFILFTDDADVETAITDAFVQLQAIIDGCSVLTALREISGALHQTLKLGSVNEPIIVKSSSQNADDTDLDGFDTDDQNNDDDDISFGLDEFMPKKPTTQCIQGKGSAYNHLDRTAMIMDLNLTKDAGFRLGKHGDLSESGIVCISVRISKLKISEEAMHAWALSKDQYLVLLMRFQQGYRRLSQVLDQSTLIGAVEMRVGLCDTYKPRKERAFAIFNQTETDAKTQKPMSQAQEGDSSTLGDFKQLFIGRPLNDLLRDRFLKIVKFRQQFKLSWGAAEKLFNDSQGALFLGDLTRDIAAYQNLSETTSARALSGLVTADSLSNSLVNEPAFPLVAMQFVLRHFVRCTEFCLVCHCKVEDTFEALKPYVCSNRLCLYQFMSLGFGPAAEWEIISQPYVVDLLVSLCHQQARVGRIQDLPVGLNLKVPILPQFKNLFPQFPVRHGPIGQPVVQAKTTPMKEPLPAFKATLQVEEATLSPITESWSGDHRLPKKGQWVVLVPTSNQFAVTYHCCIVDDHSQTLKVGTVHSRARPDASPNSEAPTPTPVNPRSIEVCGYLYEETFDDLPEQYQQHVIAFLLDSLPSVTQMRTTLTARRDRQDANLNWLQCMCPRPALDLLRWIIASNRSCIMQVDSVATGVDAAEYLPPSEDRVSGMDEWMQFRFAQGAPDKEQRFVNCVSDSSTSTEHPTLFAWHGSPLHNWHSIVRKGLNFDEIVNGRANGHGVYMSPFLTTSVGYSTNRFIPHANETQGWLNSELKISVIVSLQEVVNAPASFTNCIPHLVVAQQDWIQTRYLFVRTGLKHSSGSSAQTLYLQDPRYTVKGAKNETIAIPITAISKSRRPGKPKSTAPKNKKRKVAVEESLEACEIDDNLSVMTEQEDRDFLDFESVGWVEYDTDVIMTDADEDLEELEVFEPQIQGAVSSGNSRKRILERDRGFILDHSKTDFVPGTLDTTGIRFLDPPKSASVSASKALMRAFSETIKVQETTPLHDLGFYIDPNRMENMYQWIVELHSFDKTLPLAEDMKAAGVTSIVFEMQFTNDFPFSPPFVRVVKPRFVDPMSGGGGHITSGGAICMELLTSSGWSAVNSIESVLLQVRLAMSERERPARLLKSRGGFQTSPYGIGEAIAAYKRFCVKHGWQAPRGLDSLGIS